MGAIAIKVPEPPVDQVAGAVATLVPPVSALLGKEMLVGRVVLVVEVALVAVLELLLLLGPTGSWLA
ncbi:MAG: hypothetical protein RLZZ562_1606 [Planctomycetota bacterium]